MQQSDIVANRAGVIMVASEDEWTSRSLDSILGPHGYAVLRAQSGRTVLELARSTSPDAVILDARMRDMDGFEVCRMLRAQGALNALTPILLISAAGSSRAERLKAYAAGAWAHLSHPVDGEALLLQLRTFLNAKQQADRARDESLMDSPTGLYSMRGLAKRAREIGAEAVRMKVPLACVAVAPALAFEGRAVAVDADLTALVDHLGAILLSSGRVSDAIGRFGQNEFGVVAPATDASGATKLVERMRAALDQEPYSRDGQLLKLEISVGYQAVDNFADSPVDALEMLLQASTALRASIPRSEVQASLAASPGSNLVS